MRGSRTLGSASAEPHTTDLVTYQSSPTPEKKPHWNLRSRFELRTRARSIELFGAPRAPPAFDAVPMVEEDLYVDGLERGSSGG